MARLRSPFLLFVLLSFLASWQVACASRRVTRVDAATPVDLSGRWNDTDSRLVAEEMIRQALASPWVGAGGPPPVVIVGPIQNDTLEHIPTATFVNDLQAALAGSGRVIVVAAPDERGAVRAERADQQENARPSTRAAFGAETGADLMLGGVVSSIEDREDGKTVYYYQVDLSLTDLETNEKVWLGQKKLKKVLARGRFKA